MTNKEGFESMLLNLMVTYRPTKIPTCVECSRVYRPYLRVRRLASVENVDALHCIVFIHF